MRRTGSLGLVLVLTIGLAACGGSGGTAGKAIPTVAGEPTVTASGLKIIDIQLGSGAAAQLGDTITVQYTGYLDDGTIFDGPAIHGGPARVKLAVGSLIQGWTDGVPGIKIGGKRRLIIPPALAYGASGNGKIPPNATLTFDIELVSIP